jgi:hypothetical protein
VNWGDFADDDTRTKRFQGAMEIPATEIVYCVTLCEMLRQRFVAAARLST